MSNTFDPKNRFTTAQETLSTRQALSANSKQNPNPVELDIHTEMKFAHQNHPAGKHLSIQIDTRVIDFIVPQDIKDGGTLRLPGNGKHDSVTGKTGDLYITMHIEPKPSNKKTKKKPRNSVKLILCAAFAVVAIVLAVFFLVYKGDIFAKQHEHIWKDATCTAAKVCQECGETEGDPIDHAWVAATVNAPKTCADCGATEGSPLTVEPIYLNDLGVAYHEGKVWTRSGKEPTGSYHTNKDANPTDPGVESCWTDWETPGHTVGVVKDNQGNVYTYGISVDGKGSKIYYLEFYLGGKYTKFTGTCACPEQSAAISDRVYNEDKMQDKYFEVYLDGRLAGQSPLMRCDFAPQQFQYDVTGVNTLRILYPATDGPNEIATIFDGMLS